MTGSMAKTSLVLALFAVCQFAFACACTSVVMWCPHSESNLFDHNAAIRTAQFDPQQKMTSELKNSMSQINTIITAKQLCLEDIWRSKMLSNVNSEINLKSSSKIFYSPCVVTSVFQKIYNLIKYKYSMKDIINVDKNDQEMVNMVVENINSSSSNNNGSNCIAIIGKCRYTKRIKRGMLEENADNSTEFKIKTDDVLLYSTKPLLFKASNKSEELTQSKVVGVSSRKENKDKESTVVLSIKFANVENISSLTLEFFFFKSIGYYSLNKVNYEMNNVEMNNSLFTKRDISFPFGFSYHCSPKTIFENGTASLSIMDMQVQVDHKNATFSDAYDCVGFTSIPIWTGIFVTAILGLIMIWALIMIMDIRTMDRFDDPKGKTITISSAE